MKITPQLIRFIALAGLSLSTISPVLAADTGAGAAIVEQVKRQPGKILVLLEDTLVSQPDAAKEIVTALMPLVSHDGATVKQVIHTAVSSAPQQASQIVEAAFSAAPSMKGQIEDGLMMASMRTPTENKVYYASDAPAPAVKGVEPPLPTRNAKNTFAKTAAGTVDRLKAKQAALKNQANTASAAAKTVTAKTPKNPGSSVLNATKKVGSSVVNTAKKGGSTVVNTAKKTAATATSSVDKAAETFVSSDLSPASKNYYAGGYQAEKSSGVSYARRSAKSGYGSGGGSYRSSKGGYGSSKGASGGQQYRIVRVGNHDDFIRRTHEMLGRNILNYNYGCETEASVGQGTFSKVVGNAYFRDVLSDEIMLGVFGSELYTRLLGGNSLQSVVSDRRIGDGVGRSAWKGLGSEVYGAQSLSKLAAGGTLGQAAGNAVYSDLKALGHWSNDLYNTPVSTLRSKGKLNCVAAEMALHRMLSNNELTAAVGAAALESLRGVNVEDVLGAQAYNGQVSQGEMMPYDPNSSWANNRDRRYFSYGSVDQYGSRIGNHGRTTLYGRDGSYGDLINYRNGHGTVTAYAPYGPNGPVGSNGDISSYYGDGYSWSSSIPYGAVPANGTRSGGSAKGGYSYGAKGGYSGGRGGQVVLVPAGGYGDVSGGYGGVITRYGDNGTHIGNSFFYGSGGTGGGSSTGSGFQGLIGADAGFVFQPVISAAGGAGSVIRQETATRTIIRTVRDTDTQIVIRTVTGNGTTGIFAGGNTTAAPAMSEANPEPKDDEGIPDDGTPDDGVPDDGTPDDGAPLPN